MERRNNKEDKTSDEDDDFRHRSTWLGNYRANNDWNQCAGGQKTTYTAWSETPSGMSMLYNTKLQPDDLEKPEQCVVFNESGWHDHNCLLNQFYCLCELGVGTSAEYETWAADEYWNQVWPYLRRTLGTFGLQSATYDRG